MYIATQYIKHRLILFMGRYQSSYIARENDTHTYNTYSKYQI